VSQRHGPRPAQTSRGHRTIAPLPGRAVFLSLIWRHRDPPPSFEADRTEALLTRTPAGHVFVQIGGVRGQVEGGEERDDAALALVFERGGEPVAMVIAMVPAPGARSGPTRLDLNVHTYKQDVTGEPLHIGVGDSALWGIQRAAGEDAVRRGDPASALRWLTERLVLPPPPQAGTGAPGRVVISAAPRYDGGEPISLRLHGRGIAADVKVEGDRAVLLRVHQRRHDEQLGQLRLVHRDIAFTDVSRATRLREDMKQHLARLAAGQGFLALWHRYNRIESWWVQRLVAETGRAKYQSVHRLIDGSHRFTLAEASSPDGPASSLLDAAEGSLRGSDPLELEASASLPPVLLRPGAEPPDPGEWGLLDDELPEDTVSGTVVSVDRAAGTINVRLIEPERPLPGRMARERSTRPPPRGHLYRSYRGERRSLLRRRDAIDLVLRGGTPITNLLALLEGELTPNEGRRRRRIEAKSEAAWACFRDGAPTARQERALEVALNTPDVAVIQGPPGTGKTQLIAALQTRLAEEGRGHAYLSGSMLLSSYQHAAVDELTERSVIFGLPASKVDRAGRGTTVQADRWRSETIALIGGIIEANPEGRGLTALRRAAAIAAGYLLAPVTGAALAGQIRELEELAGDLLPGRLADRLAAAGDRLERAGAGAPVGLTEEQELALLAVRGVRVSAEAFADDGPRTAAKAVRRLRALGRDDGALAVLERAAAWSDTAPPPFLEAVREARAELLDQIGQVPGPSADPAVDPEVRALLEDVVQTLEDGVGRSRTDGVLSALFEYREALEGDPEAVLWTLREYTASYATTCQQVASQTMRDAKQLSRTDRLVFETVIVDEAARANPLDLIIPMVHAGHRIVLVGDQNQLPHMLEPEVERGFGVGEQSQLSESLFQRLFESLGRKGAPVQRVETLDQQFRMHPALGEFVSRTFYQGALKSPKPATEFVHGLTRFQSAAAAWLSVPFDLGGEGGGQSKSRKAEARAIADELEPLLEAAPDLTFGVIAFYRAQVDLVWAELAGRGLAIRGPRGYTIPENLRHDRAGRRLDRLLVGTVDEFQGKEFDVVFLSLTRCLPAQERPPAPARLRDPRWVGRHYGHLCLRNRMCVAMSRQKRLLVAVGDPATFARGTAPAGVGPLTDFLQLCRAGGPDGVIVN
jgi:hypothetical protein